MQDLKLWRFDAGGNFLGEQFSSNPAWVRLDILMRCGYSLSEIDTASFATAAAYADQLISVDDPAGGYVRLSRFQCNFALKDSQSAGAVIRSIRNGSQVYLVLNASGLLEARIENTFALQQPTLPAFSNAVSQFNGGWPAYEFDATSIARTSDGGASVKLSRKGAQDTPNRLSVEFQDSFNQYQQDSLSLADEDDVGLCGQEVSAVWDAVGISTFSQASRMLLLALNKSISGNVFVEFQTSVKALGLIPGDLITVTYAKENLQPTPFRVTKVAPGSNYRTATITARLHDDAWYSEAPTGIIGGLGTQSGRGSGLPAPVAGTVPDASGNPQLGITETEITGSDGSTGVALAVSFVAPSGTTGSLAGPLLGLAPVVSPTGGTLAGGVNYFYAVSTEDSSGGESRLSFVAQAATAPGSNTSSVLLGAIGLPLGARSFNVYRGSNPELLFRIASNQTPAPEFTDTGLPPEPVVPPDPQFDHVNAYWRWELSPETPVSIHSATTVGNSSLRLFGASGGASPITIEVPERLGSGVEVSVRAANAVDDEAEYDLSPVTGWILGQSGELATDSDVPPAPRFSAAVSFSRGGVVALGAVGFSDLANTTSIVAGTYTFHYYDEIQGPAPSPLTGAAAATDASIALGTSVPSGSLIQIDREIVQATGTNADGTTAMTRGFNSSTADTHAPGAPAYTLSEKVIIVPFAKKFFGTPVSADWEYQMELPNVRLASVELFMTNALGPGAVTVNSYTGTIDFGLRTMARGPVLLPDHGISCHSDQRHSRNHRRCQPLCSGYLRDSRLSFRGFRDHTSTESQQDTLRDYLIRGRSTTSSVVNGFGMPALNAGDQLTLDVTGVGTTTPGSDLTLVIGYDRL